MVLGDPALQARYGSGGSVAASTAAIRLNTRSIASDRAVVVREAQIMGKALEDRVGGGAERGVATASRAFDRLNKNIGITLGLIAGFGTASAQSVKALEARFRLLAGSEEQATKQLEMLRDMAEATNQPFLQVVEGATAIMPALRTSNAELGKTLLLVQRLAILDPAQGVTGAAFAIREFLSGEYMSLVRRLELDRKRLQQIRNEAQGDQAAMIQGLSDYVDELGVTEQAMYDMGQQGLNTFGILKSEMTETSADFFEPFLEDVMLPIVRAFGDLLRELRQVNPELKTFVGITAGLAGGGALAARGLPLIGAIPGGGAIARGAGIAASVYGGAQLGVFATRQFGNVGIGGGFERFRGRSQSDVMSELGRSLQQLAGILILGGSEAAKALVDVVYLLEEPVNTLKDFLDDLGGKIGEVVDFIDKLTPETKVPSGPPILPGGPIPNIIGASILQTFVAGGRRPAEAAGPEGLWGPSFDAFEEDTANLSANLLDAGYTMDQVNVIIENMVDKTPEVVQSAEDQESAADKAKDSIDDFTKQLLIGIGAIEETATAGEIFNDMIGRIAATFQGVVAASRGAGVDRLNITDELVSDWEQLQSDLAALDAEYKADTEDELAKHEARKADIIATYQARVEEVIESEGIRYERALRQTQERELDIRARAAETVAETDAELAETLSDLNTRYQDDEADALEAHLDKMRDIRRDGLNAIRRASAKLDALGIWEAQQAMQTRLEDEQDSYSTEREERQDRYEELLDDALEAADEQIRAAQDSADEQIAILWERFNKEEAMRREDTQRQLDKLRRDHEQRIAEENRQHQARMSALQTQYGQERSALYTHFAQTILATNQHLGNLRMIEEQHRAQVAKDLENWWAKNQHLYLPPDYLTAAQVQRGQQAATAVRGLFQRFQGGGPVARTGLALVHEGEEVLRRDTAAALRRMLGGDIPQVGLVGAVASAGRGMGGPTHINVFYPEGSQQWSRYELGQFFQEQLNVALGTRR